MYIDTDKSRHISNKLRKNRRKPNEIITISQEDVEHVEFCYLGYNDLKNVCFDGLDLRQTIFQGSNISGASFINCQFSDYTFFDARLRNGRLPLGVCEKDIKSYKIKNNDVCYGIINSREGGTDNFILVTYRHLGSSISSTSYFELVSEHLEILELMYIDESTRVVEEGFYSVGDIVEDKTRVFFTKKDAINEGI